MQCGALIAFCSLKWNSEAHELFLLLRAAANDQPIAILNRVVVAEKNNIPKRKEKHKTTHWIACSIFFACSIQVEINKWCFRVCVHCHLAAWQKTPWVGCCADHLNHVQRIIFCFDFVSVFLAVYSVFYVIYLVYYMHWSALGFVGLKPLRFALWREWKKKQ